VGARGEGGLAAGEAARFLFGLAIILVILFEPAGLAGIANRITGRGRARPGGKVTGRPPSTDSSTGPTPSDRPAQGSTT